MATADAAKLRVIASNFLDLHRMHERLVDVQVEHLRRPFGEWHRASFVQILVDTKKKLNSLGIRCNPVNTRHQTRINEISLQSSIRQQIVHNITNDQYILNRIRQKLQRWRPSSPIAHVSRWVLHNFDTLRKYCKPCVGSAYFRALWNGWPTSRRMKQITLGTIKPCLLNCGHGSDCLEHYGICRNLKKKKKKDWSRRI